MRSRFIVFLLVGLAIVGWCLFDSTYSKPVLAQDSGPTATPTPVGVSPHATNDCLGCHSNPNMIGRFADGKTMSLYYDPKQHAGSTHVEGCRACHDIQNVYPHKEVTQQQSCETCHSQIFGGVSKDPAVFDITYYPDERAVQLAINESCRKCHSENFDEMSDSAHTRVLEQGNRYAPVCMDCHGSHNITSPNVPRTKIPLICSKCHLSIYTTYESSVHGAALEANSNPDVPTCVNCHGSHKVTGPGSENFRADSITLCGSCHANKELMGKYGISTGVFQTYLDDFHGRTVDFWRQAGASKITKATCYDCHGIHNIQAPSNKLSSVYPANLQKTCQQCHPDASITFPEAWLSHYSPTWQDTPALFAVTAFYKFLVPTIIGGFVIYIILDARRRIADKLKNRSRKAKETSEKEIPDVKEPSQSHETGKQDEKA